METITKQQAIGLWFKFINSIRVKRELIGYGPGGYGQFVLKLESYGKEISSITLIANNVYTQEEFNHPISEKCLKKLYTPFGQFDLTIEEATLCRDAWTQRNREKGNLTFDELINALN